MENYFYSVDNQEIHSGFNHIFLEGFTCDKKDLSHFDVQLGS